MSHPIDDAIVKVLETLAEYIPIKHAHDRAELDIPYEDWDQRGSSYRYHLKNAENRAVNALRRLLDCHLNDSKIGRMAHKQRHGEE